MVDQNVQMLANGVAVNDAHPMPTANATLAALIGAANDEAGANTIIGLLKQIAANTTPSAG